MSAASGPAGSPPAPVNHLLEYLSECIGTAYLLFCIVGVVAVFSAPSSVVTRHIPSVRVRLFAAGSCIGIAGWLLAISPPGRLSGAHVNPAVSAGFWMLKKMHFADMLGYIAGQLLGAAVGAYAARALLGSWVQEVHVANLVPGPHAGSLTAFLGEAAATFFLTSALYAFLNHQSLLRITPALLVPVIAILVCADGILSGAGMNPARWFGPAWVVSDWNHPIIYSVGPLAGAALAVLVRRSGLLRNPIPVTAKLFHDARYRSLFRHDRVETANQRS